MQGRRFLVALTICCLLVAARGPLWAAAVDAHAAETHAADVQGAGSQAAAGHDGHGDHIGLADADLAQITKPEEFRSDLALFTFVVFLLLLATLWKFAWGPIVAGLQKREQSIAQHIAEAQRQHEEARQLLAQYEAKLAGAADQVRSMLEEARRDAEHTRQTILAEAKSGAEAERLRALRDIESATDAALQSLAERSADLAVLLAGKIVRQKLSPADHTRLIHEAVEKFPLHDHVN